MSTNSTISLENQDGSVVSIYCHWDGYPSNNGKILHQHYNSVDKVESLLELGFLSSLDPNIGLCEKMKSYSEEDSMINKSRKYSSFTEALEYNGREYNYLFKNGKWYVHIEKNDKIVEVVDALKNGGKYGL